jgi:hypothetical protein
METRRRALLCGATASAALVLASCESEPKPSPTATLANNDEVHAAVKSLVRSADNLNGAVGGFDDENWRDVVPNVKSAAADVLSAVRQLRQALGYSE